MNMLVNNRFKLFKDEDYNYEFFNNNKYILTRWFAVWKPTLEIAMSVPNEGWKTHIVVENEKEYILLLELMKYLQNYKVVHKVVYPCKLNQFNSFNDTQVGKILTIYTSNFEWVHYLKDDLAKAKEQHNVEKAEMIMDLINFLKEDTKIKISSDKHIGGRVFARYSGFSSDYIYNPIKKQQEEMPRKEGVYKPDWMEEPPTLEELL